MIIDWASFTPWSSLAGGILIGLAAALFILLNGRIAGISGILGGLFSPVSGDIGWRVAFIAGMLFTPLAWATLTTLPPITISAGWPALIVAGVLVGFGSRYGSGCTSGHGVCGISRFSPRSLAATAIFMSAGFASVYVVRHLIGGL